MNSWFIDWWIDIHLHTRDRYFLDSFSPSGFFELVGNDDQEKRKVHETYPWGWQQDYSTLPLHDIIITRQGHYYSKYNL